MRHRLSINLNKAVSASCIRHICADSIQYLQDLLAELEMALFDDWLRDWLKRYDYELSVVEASCSTIQSTYYMRRHAYVCISAGPTSKTCSPGRAPPLIWRCVYSCWTRG